MFPTRFTLPFILCRTLFTSVLFIAATAFTSPAVCAQSKPHWLEGSGLPGADSFVAASTSWDPDGPGPQPELLVIAGQFQVVGHQHISGLAGWDGVAWHEIDPNSGGDMYSIQALAVDHGELIAAGNFSTLGGVACNNIARFDGHAWHPLGSGPDNGLLGTIGFDYVNTLRVERNHLIVGGFFDRAGGVDAVNIAQWDGAAWTALGDGLSAGLFVEGVYSLAEYNGQLVAAGDFTRSGATPLSGVAAFDGTNWTGFEPFNAFFPFSVASNSGRLVAGGLFFDTSNPDPNYVGDSVVLEWDEGSALWIPMGSTLGRPGFLGVTKLTEFHGDLYAGGDFGDPLDFDAPGNALKRWNGNAWQAVGADFGGFNGVFQPSVSTLEIHQDHLIAGGAFSHADQKGACDLAAWDGLTWKAFGSGTNGQVFQLIPFAKKLIAAGLFDSLEGVQVPRLAAWDGHAWSVLNAPALPNAVPLGVFHGQLVVTSSAIEGQLRRLDGTVWLPFGEGIPNGFVTCMAKYQGKLIVAGSFSFIGHAGEGIDGIARWDGQHWQALGAGVLGLAWGSPVFALTVFDGKLIVGGGLDTAGGSPCNAVASWNGSAWSSLDLGLTDPFGGGVVFALATYKGELIATGQFQDAGNIAARNIARWNGVQWQALGRGGDTTLSGLGRALSVLGDDLFVGGAFVNAGGVDVHNIARWDSSSWSELDGGVVAQGFGGVETLAKFNGQLVVGGSFLETGAGVSAFLARWAVH